jgi:hypothetical protein
MRRPTLLPSLDSAHSARRIAPICLTLLLTLPLTACLEREGELALAPAPMPTSMPLNTAPGPDAARPTGSFARIITLDGLPPQALRPQAGETDAASTGTEHRPLAAAAGGGCSCGLRHAQAGSVGRWHLISEEQLP